MKISFTHQSKYKKPFKTRRGRFALSTASLAYLKVGEGFLTDLTGASNISRKKKQLGIVERSFVTKLWIGIAKEPNSTYKVTRIK